ncbi:conserved exported hypothetical protein [Bradyrhizobium sp. STM 3843]|uniref:hypothetical protein n=1 Tax=Bradyrhizobium sp. STM 3843 TaxID=551947 RepID=UPI00024033DA|nr:hypothetical protein [Bradyrhizobium sp. STM 3843]CCE08313.1 conserved exported hypothetical protein [Bradyrhizobium sp. STM 3843]
MTEHRTEFGKRKPLRPPTPSPPAKRSGHVALLLMGTLAVGGTAATLMPRRSCEPASPTMAAPPQTADACSRSGSSSGGSGGGGHWRFADSDSSRSGGSGGSSESSSGHISRGGFGAFAHGFGFSGGG